MRAGWLRLLDNTEYVNYTNDFTTNRLTDRTTIIVKKEKTFRYSVLSNFQKTIFRTHVVWSRLPDSTEYFDYKTICLLINTFSANIR